MARSGTSHRRGSATIAPLANQSPCHLEISANTSNQARKSRSSQLCCPVWAHVMDQIDLRQSWHCRSSALAEQLSLVGPPAASAYLMAPDDFTELQSSDARSRSSSTSSARSAGSASSEQIRTSAWSPAAGLVGLPTSARRSSDEWTCQAETSSARAAHTCSARRQDSKPLRPTRRR